MDKDFVINTLYKLSLRPIISITFAIKMKQEFISVLFEDGPVRAPFTTETIIMLKMLSGNTCKLLYYNPIKINPLFEEHYPIDKSFYLSPKKWKQFQILGFQKDDSILITGEMGNQLVHCQATC